MHWKDKAMDLEVQNNNLTAQKALDDAKIDHLSKKLNSKTANHNMLDNARSINNENDPEDEMSLRQQLRHTQDNSKFLEQGWHNEKKKTNQLEKELNAATENINKKKSYIRDLRKERDVLTDRAVLAEVEVQKLKAKLFAIHDLSKLPAVTLPDEENEFLEDEDSVDDDNESVEEVLVEIH